MALFLVQNVKELKVVEPELGCGGNREVKQVGAGFRNELFQSMGSSFVSDGG